MSKQLKPDKVAINEILQELIPLCPEVKFSMKTICSKGRESGAVFQRALICAWMRRTHSAKNIATILGKRSHATVLNLLSYDSTNRFGYYKPITYNNNSAHLRQLYTKLMIRFGNATIKQSISYHEEEIKKLRKEMR